MRDTKLRTTRLSRRLGAGLAGAGLLLGALLGVGVASGGASAAPIGCGSDFFYSSSTTKVFDRATDGTVTSIDTAPTVVNSIAFSPVDGNLYTINGFSGSSNHLFRIEAAGGATDLGAVAGLPVGGVFGASFDDAGVLWVATTSDPSLYGIDVSSVTATRLPLTTSVGGDLAFVGGSMYALKSGTIARIDLTTGAVSQSSPVAGMGFPGGSSLWSMDGHLYVNTGTGIADVLNFTTTTPTLQPVVTPVLPGTVGDGAACQTAANPFLNAQADDFSGTPLFAGVGGSAGNLYSNDTLNGAAFTPSSVTPAVLADGGLGATISSLDGTLSVPATAAAGTYAVTYRICETAAGSTGVCDTATATVAVRALPVVSAADDDFTATAITAGTAGTAGNVLTGDTIDGAPATPANVTATITNDGGLTGAALTAAGDLTVPAAATAGTYTVTYQICATAAPTACDTATATVRVAAVQTPPVTGPGGPGAGTGAPAGGSPAAVGTQGRDDTLASTGSDVAAAGPWAVTAILLTLAGAALLLLRRRTAA